MSDLFGWELLYNYTEKDITKKEDVLVMLLHYVLIRNGYKCIGVGEDKSLTGNEVSGEVLPPGWSASNNYSLRYVLNNQLYILRGVPVDESIVFNLLHVTSLNVSNIALIADQLVHSTRGRLEEMVPTHDEIMSRIKKELIHPSDASNKEATTQTTQPIAPPPGSSRTPPDPSHPWPDTPPHVPPMSADPFSYDVQRDPLRVGRNDLDPLGRGSGGGMLFNPFEPRHGTVPDPGLGTPGNLPRGAIPPHARFDPFGPPAGPRPFPRYPGPDQFNPPGGFGGGMFL